MLIILVGLWPTGNLAQAQTPVVHAVLFFSRTCLHCHKVMTEDLPPLMEQHGEQLSILAIGTVTQQAYATLFGLIPIGVLGLLGYGVIGITWLIMSYGPVAWRRTSTLFLWLLALSGTLFSIYLTLLEPFVIGVSCAWCLSSAVVMALLLWATTAPVEQLELVYGR